MSEEKTTYSAADIAAQLHANAVVTASETMIGDLVSLVRDECQALPSVWPGIGDDAKRDLYERWERRVTHAVGEAVKILATQSRPHVFATVEQVTFKDGVKVVLQLARTEGAHQLADATQQQVLVVVPEDIGSSYGGGVPGKQIGMSLD